MENRQIIGASIWVSSFLILYNFTANLANDIYLPSMPELVRIFHTSPSVLQLTMTAWFAGVSLPQLFFGPLSDRFGRRKVLLFGAILFLLATLICTAANNIWILIAARYLQGVGVCSLNVTTFGILADLYDAKSRTQIVNKINMCGILAPLIGPLIGGYILFYFGWRMNFVLIFLFAAFGISGLWYKLPESNVYLNPYALHWNNIYKNYILLLRTKNFLKHLIPYSLLLGGIVAYLTAAPFLIIDQMHVQAENFGFTQMPIFAAFLVGGFWVGNIKSEANLLKISRMGMGFIFLASIVFIIFSLLYGNQLYALILPMLIYAFGFSLCGSVLVNEVMSAAVINKGSAAAFLGFAMALSCFINSLLIGMIYNGAITSLAFLISTLSLISVLVFFMPFKINAPCDVNLQEALNK